MGDSRIILPAIAGILILGVIAIGISVYADDLNPPDYRGFANSLYFEWTSSLPATGNTLTSSDVFVQGPSIYPLFDYEPIFGPGPKEGAIANCFENANSCVIILPNFIDDLERKFLRIQVSYTGSPAPSTLAHFFFTPTSGSQPGGQCTLLDRVDTSGYYYEDWECLPNPIAELLTLSSPSAEITQIVIDTISFSGAEPSLGSKEVQKAFDTSIKILEKACKGITKEITNLDEAGITIPNVILELELRACGP